MSRLEDALNLICDKVPKETKEIFNKVLQVYYDTGYYDWNDWEEYLSDESEDGLKAYLMELFNVKEES